MQHLSRSLLPVSGVDPWSLSSVVVNVKDSAIKIPGFLPARGQRQLRALSPLTAAHPRHSAAGTVGGSDPLPLLQQQIYHNFLLHYKSLTPINSRKQKTSRRRNNRGSNRHRQSCIHLFQKVLRRSHDSVCRSSMFDSIYHLSFHTVHIRAGVFA